MVPADLIGGPEDGRQVCKPGSAEAPLDRFVLPARLVDEDLAGGGLPLLLRYDRGERDPGGRWRYHFVGCRFPPPTACPSSVTCGFSVVSARSDCDHSQYWSHFLACDHADGPPYRSV